MRILAGAGFPTTALVLPASPGDAVPLENAHGLVTRSSAVCERTPDDAWFGMEMGVVPHGQRRYVVSALRQQENPGKDAVADKMPRLTTLMVKSPFVQLTTTPEQPPGEAGLAPLLVNRSSKTLERSVH